MLLEFDVLEFIIDDSGSMNSTTDCTDPRTHMPMSRWREAQYLLKEMIEIIAYIPFGKIVVEFLNRQDQVILTRQGQEPAIFIQDANGIIDAVFVQGPAGTTPLLEKLQRSLIRSIPYSYSLTSSEYGKSVSRYFFVGSTPNGGERARMEIVNILINRQNPEFNPITFISCTKEDDRVGWMKNAEELVPYCSELGYFRHECVEVLREQGAALPYTKGFHLIRILAAASNPDDLDVIDESVPFTKNTLDNLLGIQHSEESYRYYFDCFVRAQRARKVDVPSDQLKKNVQWNYGNFLRIPRAKDIPQVQQFKQQLSYEIATTFESGTLLVDELTNRVDAINIVDNAMNLNFNGGSYSGDVTNGIRDGKGSCDYPNGDVYVGEWKDGKPNGPGTWKTPGGLVYDGEWKEGTFHGVGMSKSIPHDGMVYMGNWKENKFHGTGVCNYPNGDNYVGQWKEGKRHGVGTCIFDDGHKRTGEWKDDKYYYPGRCVIIKDPSGVEWGDINPTLDPMTGQPQLDSDGLIKVTIQSTNKVDVVTLVDGVEVDFFNQSKAFVVMSCSLVPTKSYQKRRLFRSKRTSGYKISINRIFKAVSGSKEFIVDEREAPRPFHAGNNIKFKDLDAAEWGDPIPTLDPTTGRPGLQFTLESTNKVAIWTLVDGEEVDFFDQSKAFIVVKGSVNPEETMSREGLFRVRRPGIKLNLSIDGVVKAFVGEKEFIVDD